MKPLKVGPLRFDPQAIAATLLFVAYGLDQFFLSPDGTNIATWLHIPNAILVGAASFILYFAQAIHVDPTKPPAAPPVGPAAAMLLVCFLGCQQLQPIVPYFNDVAAVIVKDLEAGDTAVQIEEDVTAAILKQAGASTVTSTFVATVIADVTAFLIDTGAISPKLFAKAQDLRDAEKAKLSP